jgi:hypothetical protein
MKHGLGLATLVLSLLVLCVAGVAGTTPVLADERSGVLTTREIVGVFQRNGIALHLSVRGARTTPDAFVGFPKGRAYGVLVSVFRKADDARHEFQREWRGWHSSGITVRRLRNVIVLVVPPGARMGVKGTTEPMPRPVAMTLKQLAQR